MSSRESLKQWCLRALGAPVVEINVADEQLEDRIDEALSYFNLYHYEGAEKFYLTHLVTNSTLKITTPVADQFTHGATLTGTTSGATAKIEPTGDNTVIHIRNVKGDFLEGEDVTDGTTTATLSSTNPYTAGDTETHTIPIPDSVFGIVRVLPINQLHQNSTQMFWDVQYQLMLNDVRNLTNTDITYYVQAMQHLDLLAYQLAPLPDFEFNRMTGRLRLDFNWNKIDSGQIIVLEAYRAVDPNAFKKIWQEPWLRQYTTALFKRQWGINMKKFSGLKLPGGVSVDGDKIFQEAMLDIKQLEVDLVTKYAPLSWYMG